MIPWTNLCTTIRSWKYKYVQPIDYFIRVSFCKLMPLIVDKGSLRVKIDNLSIMKTPNYGNPGVRVIM